MGAALTGAHQQRALLLTADQRQHVAGAARQPEPQQRPIQLHAASQRDRRLLAELDAALQHFTAGVAHHDRCLGRQISQALDGAQQIAELELGGRAAFEDHRGAGVQRRAHGDLGGAADRLGPILDRKRRARGAPPRILVRLGVTEAQHVLLPHRHVHRAAQLVDRALDDASVVLAKLQQ